MLGSTLMEPGEVEVIRADPEFAADEAEYWHLWSHVCMLVGHCLADKWDSESYLDYENSQARMKVLYDKWGFGA